MNYFEQRKCMTLVLSRKNGIPKNKVIFSIKQLYILKLNSTLHAKTWTLLSSQTELFMQTDWGADSFCFYIWWRYLEFTFECEMYRMVHRFQILSEMVTKLSEEPLSGWVKAVLPLFATWFKLSLLYKPFMTNECTKLYKVTCSLGISFVWGVKCVKYCKTLFISAEFNFAWIPREHGNAKIKFSPIISNNERVIEQDITNHENKVTWIYPAWLPRIKKLCEY